MAKPELGTKRLCPNCSTKYYDLNRDPILCPKCGTPFTIAALALRAKAAPIAEEEEEEEAAALPVDFVSLEEADAEETGEADVPGVEDEEIEDIGDDDDDTFLAVDEEDDDIDGIDIDVAGEDEEP